QPQRGPSGPRLPRPGSRPVRPRPVASPSESALVADLSGGPRPGRYSSPLPGRVGAVQPGQLDGQLARGPGRRGAVHQTSVLPVLRRCTMTDPRSVLPTDEREEP